MADKDMNFELPEQIVRFYERNSGKYPSRKAGLIPTLMECQKYFGHVTPEMAEAVSELTSVPFSEVESVISFYTMFLTKPSGKYIIGACCTWNCEHAGSRKIVEHYKSKYGVGLGETTEDGMFTLLQVECLADCHNAPSLQFLTVGEAFSADWANNLNVATFDAILEDLKAGNPDALRERIVRVEEKLNPPDSGKWAWVVTTKNQYAVKVVEEGGPVVFDDGYGKLKGVSESNPKLYAELKEALSAVSKSG